MPQGAKRSPVVIFWHGGMWMRGSKDDVRFVGAALARSGHAAVVPNYQLHPQVRHPAFVEDGARAVAWVRESISKFKGDSNSLFPMGHSAGAYIATMLAFDQEFLRSQGTSTQCIRGVIDLAGPHTLERPSIFIDSIFGKPRLGRRHGSCRSSHLCVRASLCAAPSDCCSRARGNCCERIIRAGRGRQ